ncbi:hypothetical protein PAXRUDRAFT_24472 [Paxillus rubicundulus Ve08.2h10]|uniref:Uncharacterized protein n=1 Tax=Paxillus rubicundulus Ve08.2h10 TaxID=930991 RepID=A0A0D0EBL1_9AGAM|nr:hypothetical protein PAXRUDRAFT_24472 [Paxillus rubicundulus Ve08.2h10]
MNKSHRCNNDIHNHEYKHKYSQHSVTLPMPPGYTPHCIDLTNNVSDSNSPEPRPASAVSKMYHSSKWDPSKYYGNQEHQFGRDTSNEWGYYPRHRFLHELACIILTFPHTTPSIILTIPHARRREKNHLKHKVSKLKTKVISLEGKLLSSHYCPSGKRTKVEPPSINKLPNVSHSTTPQLSGPPYHNIKIVHVLPLPSNASEPVCLTTPTVLAPTSITSSQTVPMTNLTGLVTSPIPIVLAAAPTTMPPSLSVLEELAATFLTQTNLSSGLALSCLTPNKAPESINAVQDTMQKPTGKRKWKVPDPNSVMRPDGKSTSTCNLYAIEWCKQNKKGTCGQYTEYWDMLVNTKDSLVEVYEQCLATVKGLKKQSTGTGTATSAPLAVEDNMDEV